MALRDCTVDVKTLRASYKFFDSRAALCGGSAWRSMSGARVNLLRGSAWSMSTSFSLEVVLWFARLLLQLRGHGFDPREFCGKTATCQCKAKAGKLQPSSGKVEQWHAKRIPAKTRNFRKAKKLARSARGERRAEQFAHSVRAKTLARHRALRNLRRTTGRATCAEHFRAETFLPTCGEQPTQSNLHKALAKSADEEQLA